MLKEVTKNPQAISPTCNHSPLCESMQAGLNVTKCAAAENTPTYAMATALASSNPAAVGLSDSHTGLINGELPIVDKSPIKLTIKRKNIPSDTSSPSPKPEESFKSDNQGNSNSIIGLTDSSTHRHTAINGKILPSNASSSLSHPSHGEQSRTASKRTSSGGPSASKRPKSTSKRDRSSCNKSAILPLSTSPNLVNGRPNPVERAHDPYQFSVKKEEETVLPPKKLRLDSSLNRLPDRTESFKDQGTNTRNQGTSVDHDLLGPCEPGTQINLDGYVCLETLTGMLMVSVQWRNRTYLGTLIDSTSHGFSPPVPPSYVYHSNRYSSAIEAGGGGSTGNGNGRNQRGRGKRRCGFAPTTGARHSRKGRRNARGSPVTGSTVPTASHNINPGDDSNEESQSRGESPASENTLDDGEPSFKCPQPGCHKRFKDGTAGKFHMDECHSKKTCDLPSESESVRDKRPKTAKSTGKSKRHTTANASARVMNSQLPAVKSEPVTSVAVPDTRTVKSTETVTIKSELPSSNIPAPFFKTPMNNGVTSPPLLPYSPTSPSAPHLPSSPANGLKHPGSSGNSCSPETLTLPLNVSSHQVKHSPASSVQQQQIPPSQQHELPVRIPTSNMLVRVGVTSTSGGSSISSATISVNSSSSSAPRTVTATTVKTIPVMKPSTVASSSSMSAGGSSGKKSGSKEAKGSSGMKANNSRSSHSSGTVSASTVTVPAVSSPLAATSQAGGICSASLKPIQPKPLVPPMSPSPNGNNGNKNANIPNQTGAGGDPSKRATNPNPSRKRKKSSGAGADSGKRQSLSSSCGNAARASQGKPVSGGKRNSGGPGGVCSDGVNAGQGDRASPAYSDISDDNESPIPILEKEGDVKLLSDATGGCDEVGKASEQTSGSGAFYNTPPSLVPFSVYSANDQTTAAQGNFNSGCRVSGISSGACRPTSLTKKASSPTEGLPIVNPSGLGKAGTPVIPGTAPLTLTPSQGVKKMEPGRGKEFGNTVVPERLTPTNPPPPSSVEHTTGSDALEKSDTSKSQPVRIENSHSIDDHIRVKKSNEPPNLTKISTPTPLTLSMPSPASSVTASNAIPMSSSSQPSQNTVAKPTPVNPLSPSRSSDLPSSTPAVVTPGVLVGGSRSSELYPSRPDHLPTPPSFHPAPPGGPFAPGAQFAAHLSSPGPLGPQSPFPPYAPDMLRFVHPGGPHPAAHPFGGYPYPAEPFFASPPVTSTPQPHKIHELVEKSVVNSTTPSATSAAPGVPSLCTSTSTTASNMSSKPCLSGESAIPMDLQTAKSLADMAVAMRHHASILPNHGGIPQGPSHGGMVAHFPYSGAIPPAHMTAPPFAAMQQHSLPPGHPATPDNFFSPSTILNHHMYK